MKTARSNIAVAIVAMLAVVVSISAARSAHAGETSLYFKSGWYTWDETINGRSFVKEQGMLYGVGVTHKDPVSVISIAERVEVWGGNLDYDGHDVTGVTPIKSDTSYLGTREEVTISGNITATSALSIEPFAGIGHKFWIRTRSSEDWNTFYGRFGIGAALATAKAIFFVKGGALTPFYTRTHVTLSDAGYDDVVTEPESRVSAFAEGGATFGSFTLSVEYEGMKFGESARVPTINRAALAKGAVVVGGQAYQPDSSSTFVAFKLAYRF